jgi:integrase
MESPEGDVVLENRRTKVELYEQIRREYEHGAGTIRAVARRLGCTGEMLAVRRRHIAPDQSSVKIEQRVYRGVLDDPKNSQSRAVAVPPRTAALLKEWLDTAVDPDPDAWVFASENRETPLWRDNLLRRHVRPALRKVGLGWVDFKVMRRTNASLGQDAKVDPKVSADQRGHGIGVSLDVYTKTSIQRKAEGAQQLEDAVLGRKAVPIREKVAS